MIADLKPYPTYKDSGVGWLGEVPEGWEVPRAKRLLEERHERSVQGTERLLSVSQYTGVTVNPDQPDDRASLEGYRVVQGDDLVVNIMLAWNGSLGVSVSQGVVSPAYAVYRFRGGDPTYFHFLLRSSPAKARLKASSRGVVDSRLRLYSDDLMRIELPVPSLNEQKEIARFLNTVDRVIDRFATATQRQIELLEEEKQAVIHRAVTRGLDPNVRLKPSGVDWLGDVPEHWEVVDLGRVTEVLAGYAFSSRDFSSDPTDPRLLRGVNIAPDAVRWDETVRWPRERVASVDRYILCQGDIVLGLDRPIVGSGLRVARVREADLPALLLQRVARLRTTTRLDADFAFQFLRGPSFMRYIEPILTGISVPHLSPDQLRRFKIALPPPEEQKRIMRWLEERLQSSEAVTPRSRRQIDLLDELRTRLIADVVTGKLDVREAAAGLSDDPDAEPAAVDRLRESVSA